MRYTFQEQILLFLVAAFLGIVAAVITYVVTSNGDTAGTIGIIVWLAAWLGIVFLDPSDLFN